jgi:hypothetical protein
VYSSTPSSVLPLDSSISTLFWAEVDGQAPRELIATDARGAKIYVFQDGDFTLSGEVEFSSLLPSNVKEPRSGWRRHRRMADPRPWRLHHSKCRETALHGNL